MKPPTSEIVVHSHTRIQLTVLASNYGPASGLNISASSVESSPALLSDEFRQGLEEKFQFFRETDGLTVLTLRLENGCDKRAALPPVESSSWLLNAVRM